MSEKKILEYKGRPLRRKDDFVYYGDMGDSHVIVIKVLDKKMVEDLEVATKVLVQLQLTDPDLKSRDKVLKKLEKDSLYAALDIGSVWLERALTKK